MQPSVPLSTFDSAYAAHSAPWVIGEPQPAIVALEQHGWIRGAVLDAGCGSGEQTIHLSRLGYDTLGIDFSGLAVDQARANAEQQRVTANFEVADALDLGDEARFDTVVDSALFHVFNSDDRAEYARGLHRVCRPGALVHVLALSDVDPGFGPTVSEQEIREAFGQGWELEDLRRSRYRGVVDAEQSVRLSLPAGEPADMLAWLARARRI